MPELDAGHVYHLFVVRSESRAAVQQHLASVGIETLIHYPTSISRQGALAGQSPAACPEAERACADVLSLPLHPALGDEDIDAIATAVKEMTCVR